MPKIRNITVHVTDGDGNALHEWGEQNLRGNKVSAYIESKAGMPFKVSIQPDLPYDHHTLPLQKRGSESGEWEDIDDTQVKMEEVEEDTNRSWTPHIKQRSSPQDHHKHHRSFSSGFVKHDKSHHVSPPPFSFLATLYLDGRKKPERRSVVYLDSQHEDFSQPDGRIQFKSRLVQLHDGRLEEKAWVFKELGIETVFNKIALRDSSKDVMEPEDQLVDAMGKSLIGDKELEVAEGRRKVGQIVVELHRITLGRPYYEPRYRASHRDGENEDVDMEGLTTDAAHTTGFDHRKTLKQQDIKVVHYYDYRLGEGPWAVVQFFYRSHEQLQKFNFNNFPVTSQKPSRDRRFIDKQMASVTPLSFTQAKTKLSSSSEEKEPSFEDRVNGGRHESAKSMPQYEFVGYRDPPSASSVKLQRVSNAKRKLSASALKEIDLEEIHERNCRDLCAPSAVVAVKEKLRRPSHGAFTVGPNRSSSSTSHSEGDGSPSVPNGSPAQYPLDPPTKECFNPLPDPCLSATKGVEVATFKTLSDASLRLSKEKESTQDSPLTPKSGVHDTNFRRLDYESEWDADDEKEDQPHREASPSGIGSQEDSDKENNVASTDNDDAGLHLELNRVSLGCKRRLGEGIEELDGRTLQEMEKGSSHISSEEKKQSSHHGQPAMESPGLSQQELSMVAQEKELAADSEEKKAKRVKPSNDKEATNGHGRYDDGISEG
ncbi:MAG: hypothetical protein Q9203_001490 [Teloschistes exilis]